MRHESKKYKFYKKTLVLFEIYYYNIKYKKEKRTVAMEKISKISKINKIQKEQKQEEKNKKDNKKGKGFQKFLDEEEKKLDEKEKMQKSRAIDAYKFEIKPSIPMQRKIIQPKDIEEKQEEQEEK